MENERLIRLNIMARRLGVPARWLRAEADAGKIPCLKAENIYLFDQEVVINILAERARKGGSSNA